MHHTLQDVLAQYKLPIVSKSHVQVEAGEQTISIPTITLQQETQLFKHLAYKSRYSRAYKLYKKPRKIDPTKARWQHSGYMLPGLKRSLAPSEGNSISCCSSRMSGYPAWSFTSLIW